MRAKTKNTVNKMSIIELVFTNGKPNVLGYGHNQGIFDRVNESNNKWERYPTVIGTAHVGKNFKAATNTITNANREWKTPRWPKIKFIGIDIKGILRPIFDLYSSISGKREAAPATATPAKGWPIIVAANIPAAKWVVHLIKSPL